MQITAIDTQLTKLFEKYYIDNNIFRSFRYILGQEQYLESACGLIKCDLKRLGLQNYINVEIYKHKYYKRIIYYIYLKLLDDNNWQMVYGLLRLKGII